MVQHGALRTSLEGMKRIASITMRRDNERRDLESQSHTKSSGRTHSIWWNVFIDLPLLAVVLTVLGLYEFRVIPSHKAGFFCQDPKLNYTLNGDTVSGAALVSSALLLPIAFILITEVFLLDSEYLVRSRTTEALRRTALLFRAYSYGFCFNFIIVEVMKGITGMPRPVFFDQCAPDTNVDCIPGEYVSTFECTSSNSWWAQYDSYHSFPSGHTSLSVYCGLFIAWYLQRRAFSWSGRTVLLVPFLQLCCASYAALCSLSRITDHRHHWWDVLVGAVVGVLTMLFAVLVICDNFSIVREREDASRIPKSTTNLLYGTQRARPSS
ncbi:hypothetical protein MSG28_008911 [Choristoneura fumiferana]|uniref:Uncharacterized protein n=1 Tax=Choristoneura fumiferana TaxID=7141 RepID=A0ACC0J8H7_CHOFU|nr:hypothetical protein MSG28_008911 [Choristoneura fumiferana]